MKSVNVSVLDDKFQRRRYRRGFSGSTSFARMKDTAEMIIKNGIEGARKILFPRQQHGFNKKGLADMVGTTLEPDRAAEANGESSFTCETTEWTLLITSLLLEGISAVFDQLNYALIGMVMAFVALLLSTFDLVCKARKGRVGLDGTRLLPCFYRRSAPNAPDGKPFCTIVEYFGLVGGVWQCFYSGMQYQYSGRNEYNPVQMCLLPFIFILGVVISKLISSGSQERLTEPPRRGSSLSSEMQMPLAADAKAVDIGEEARVEETVAFDGEEVDMKFDDMDQRMRERFVRKLRQKWTGKSRTLSI